MTTLECELVGGPFDGLRFSLDGMLRAFPGGTPPGAAPERLVMWLFADRPAPAWGDAVHLCFTNHPPGSRYRRANGDATRYRYAGPYDCDSPVADWPRPIRMSSTT